VGIAVFKNITCREVKRDKVMFGENSIQMISENCIIDLGNMISIIEVRCENEHQLRDIIKKRKIQKYLQSFKYI
jgi:hypothetical protein